MFIGESGVATPTQGTSVHDDWYCIASCIRNITYISSVGDRFFCFFFHIDNQGGGYERPSMAWHIWSCYWHVCNLKLLLSYLILYPFMKIEAIFCHRPFWFRFANRICSCTWRWLCINRHRRDDSVKFENEWQMWFRMKPVKYLLTHWGR